MSDNVIRIFDTTLRDGEQSPGCSMTKAEKLEVAGALVELGVDIIEAGFPIASPGDFDSVKAIAEKYGDQTIICGLARCITEDIDRAWEALKEAEKSRIHLFLATSAIHMQYKLKMAEEEILRRTTEMVSRARGYCEDIEFSPEDASRTDLDFLCQVVETAITAGATTVNIPDTVGYATPNHYYKMIRTLKEKVPNIEQAVISTHCHNDLGLAVANSLSAVEAGARQVECTINGLGERAGNASLEEIVMAIRTRADFYQVQTNINSTKLVPISRLVSNVTGMRVQRNKAIVGQNAFAHEAGIHQHGMMQESSTYEIMKPEDVGFLGTNLVLGKHSGRHAFRDRLKTLGYNPDEETFQKVFEDFIALADKKKEIFDADIVAILDQRSHQVPETWSLLRLHTSAGTGTIPTATPELKNEETGEIRKDAATGDGPIDAVFVALERIIGFPVKLQEFDVSSVSSGKDALGEVVVTIADGSQIHHGKGVSTDIIEAAARAYLQALNKVIAKRKSEE